MTAIPISTGGAEAVVDFLAVVVEGHQLQRNFVVDGNGGRFRQVGKRGKFARAYVAALVQFGLRRGIHARAKGVDRVKSLPFNRSDVLPEQGQNEGFLWLQHAKPDQGDKGKAQEYAAYNDDDVVFADRAQNDSCRKDEHGEKTQSQRAHTVLFVFQNLFFHFLPPCRKNIILISL